ncbi:MAG TPA: LLM class flavin-dependent oxidoreductase [Acidimicrobiales bacterium]|jgi:alkanesulfonate monooxygenase SsuD/methylene tetrahydromethanopterin reductase-like flavin-dependent oxidoreductase (luciferase family)
MKVGLVILPSDRWREARRQWQWADAAGFTTAWTYDHIRWGGMPDGPWHSAFPVLAAAAGVTTRLRLGTLVATPNFRHPVTLAREALALDDLSDGRLDLGVGPGSEGPDATVLGQDAWAPSERMARFEQFLGILRRMVDGDATTRTTVEDGYYACLDAPSTPGAVQSPLPVTVAAGGPRGLRLAAAHGDQWVTIGPTGQGERTPAAILEHVRLQCAALDVACDALGRAPSTLPRVLLWTPTEPALTSLQQLEDLVAPYRELGIDQFVLHHPEQTGPYGGSLAVFEKIAARYAEG